MGIEVSEESFLCPAANGTSFIRKSQRIETNCDKNILLFQSRGVRCILFRLAQFLPPLVDVRNKKKSTILSFSNRLSPLRLLLLLQTNM